MDTINKTELEHNLCVFCQSTPKKYTCPRCNADYCSLICFQVVAHMECAEAFYKNCVLENMPQSGDDNESKQKMMEVFTKLHENKGLEFENDSNEDSESSQLDSDDDDSKCATLEERLANIDLNDTAEVWENLTADERQEFEAFLRSGEVGKFVPKWEPWWLMNDDTTKIQEVAKIQSYKEKCPKIKDDVKEFSDITKKIPSPCVQYNLINILTAYAFTVRYFNGDHFEFLEEAVGYIINLSLCLKENRNFENLSCAVESVHEECVKNDWITVDEENINLMKEDVPLILKGPQQSDKKYYILSLLSDLHNLISSLLEKGNAQGTNCFLKHCETYKLRKDKAKLCLKKLEYFLSYVVYCYD